MHPHLELLTSIHGPPDIHATTRISHSLSPPPTAYRCCSENLLLNAARGWSRVGGQRGEGAELGWTGHDDKPATRRGWGQSESTWMHRWDRMEAVCDRRLPAVLGINRRQVYRGGIR